MVWYNFIWGQLNHELICFMLSFKTHQLIFRPFRLDRENFYQMFVHGIKDDRPLVLMLNKDELGQALRDNVQRRCPKLPSSFILLHQGRKVLLTDRTYLIIFASFLLNRKLPFYINPLTQGLDFFQFNSLTVACRWPHRLIAKIKTSIPQFQQLVGRVLSVN